ncbi:MAG: hypothetical protein SFY92_03500 [Verrucomicrobiae bacterium]|nr:hypothetical protein [Verrucomicrobiae bacterium]
MKPSAAVAFAVREEAESFLRSLRNKRTFSLEGIAFTVGDLETSRGKLRRLIVFRLGMGRLNADTSTRTLLAHFAPKFLIVCGFAGGVDPALRTGDALVSENVSDPELLARAREGLGNKLGDITIHYGYLQTVEKIINAPDEKSGLGRGTVVSAIDMETAAVVPVARDKKCPLLSIRVISDAADEPMPVNFNEFLDEHCRLQYGRLLLHLLLHPTLIPELIRFSGTIKKCSRRLGLVLINVLQE